MSQSAHKRCCHCWFLGQTGWRQMHCRAVGRHTCAPLEFGRGSLPEFCMESTKMRKVHLAGATFFIDVFVLPIVLNVRCVWHINLEEMFVIENGNTTVDRFGTCPNRWRDPTNVNIVSGSVTNHTIIMTGVWWVNITFFVASLNQSR